MISIKVEGLDEVRARLDKIASQKMRDDINRAASGMAYANVIKHFSEQSSQEGKWQPWSDEYRKRMRARGRAGNRILQDTGALRQSIKPGVDKDGAYVLADSEYAAAHNYGSREQGIPQREFMYIDDATVGKIEDYIVEKIEAS